jgi:hypothetical protein
MPPSPSLSAPDPNTQAFPVLTPAQIDRIRPLGHTNRPGRTQRVAAHTSSPNVRDQFTRCVCRGRRSFGECEAGGVSRG